jgi:hypothetical protein
MTEFRSYDPLKIGRQVGEDAMFHRVQLAPVELPIVITIEEYLADKPHDPTCQCTKECGGGI